MLSVPDLTAQLTALGLREGAVVMVHASLRRLGPVEGRADGVLDAIEAAIGPTGTVLMVLGADADEPFDVHTTEVDIEDMGVLAEVFRTRPGTCLTDHAAARYGARGPAAEALLADPPLHDYHGPGSPLDRLVAHDGVVLRLGADPDTTTLTHYAEYLAALPHKRRVAIPYTRADTGTQVIESLDDTHGIVDWPDGDYFPAIRAAFVAAGHARTGPVGTCTAELLPARAFVDFAVDWMEAHLCLPRPGRDIRRDD